MRTIALHLFYAVLMVASTAMAQSPPTIPRIGFLGAATSSDTLTRRLDPFRQGLRELGYLEGRHFVLEVRSAEADFSLLPALAAELVRLKVDVIVTAGPQPTRYAKEATSTIPIVMAFDTDPVGNKFVASLARPGGNITGLSDFAPEISGKGLELLQEIVPRLSRVAILGTSSRPGNARSLKETLNAAQALGINLQNFDVLTPKDIEVTFRAAANDRVDGAVVMHSAIHSSHQRQFADLAIKTKIPVMYARQNM